MTLFIKYSVNEKELAFCDLLEGISDYRRDYTIDM